MPPSRSLGSVSRQALHQRKVDAVLADEPFPLPPPDAAWGREAREAYAAYARADVARLLREEDVPQVIRYFATLDRLLDLEARYDAARAADAPDRVLDTLYRTIRSADAVAARMQRDLGLGPRHRIDLGLLQAQGVKAAAEADEFLDG